jgi:tRNA threonylcarbamoyladenosine biosynthesis protein TsaB
VAPEAICEAQDIVRLAAVSVSKGELTPPELAQPVYLRDRVTDRR